MRDINPRFALHYISENKAAASKQVIQCVIRSATCVCHAIDRRTTPAAGSAVFRTTYIDFVTCLKFAKKSLNGRALRVKYYFALLNSQTGCFLLCYKVIQDAQLSQRDRAAGYISFGRKWKTGTQRQYFTDIVSLASTTVT